MKTAKSIRKQYKATFILDTHKWTEPIEALIEQIKETIAEIDGEVLEVKPLGIKQFARCPRKEFIAAPYVSIVCVADPNFNKLLKERIGLNPNVNRVMVETN